MAKRTENISINGMTCGHCKNSVVREISEVPGVVSVEVTIDPGKAVITYDDEITTIELIKKAVNETGVYSAG